MSFAQILEELPKLTAPERREIFLQVLSLEPEIDDLAVCDHVAMEGFAMLEEMESADRKSWPLRAAARFGLPIWASRAKCDRVFC
jgi:hypothetical protein